MRKLRTCTFLHFRSTRCRTHCPHRDIKPQVDRFVFPDGHLVIVLASGRLRILG